MRSTNDADRLLGAFMAPFGRYPRMGYGGFVISDAYAYMLRGEPDLAIDALRPAVDQGKRSGWRDSLRFNPILKPLHGSPEFQVIVAEVEADMAAQRERAKSMIGAGQLPIDLDGRTDRGSGTADSHTIEELSISHRSNC